MYSIAKAFIAGATLSIPIGIGLGISIVSSEDVRGIDVPKYYETAIENGRVNKTVACGLVSRSISNINNYFAEASSASQGIVELEFSYSDCRRHVTLKNGESNKYIP